MAVGYFPNSVVSSDAESTIASARYHAPIAAQTTYAPDRPLFEHTAGGATAPRWIAFSERPRYISVREPDGRWHAQRTESEWRILGIVTAPNTDEAKEIAQEAFVRPVSAVQSVPSFIAEREQTISKPLDKASLEWWMRYRARLGARGTDSAVNSWNAQAIESGARSRVARQSLSLVR